MSPLSGWVDGVGYAADFAKFSTFKKIYCYN